MAIITGDNGNNILPGTPDNDTIRGLGGNDQLNGGAGDDILDAGLGTADEVDGGIGIDTLVIDYSSVSTNVSRLGNSYITSGNRTFYSNIEQFNITTGSGNDELIGGVFNDILNGGAGNDVISGGGGNDVLNGGAGDDIITKGAGADTVDGGTGIDTLVDADFSADTTGRTLTITGSTLATIVSGGNTYQGLEFLRNITAGSGNDNIRQATTIQENNQLNGGAGDDILGAGLGTADEVDGGIGIDTLVIDYSSVSTNVSRLGNSYITSGNRTFYSNIEQFNITTGSGNDELIGGVFNDILNGGAGNDVISGGGGNDVLNGGAGDDIITKGAGADTVDGGTGIDTLVDADFSADTTGRTLTITGSTLATIVSGGNTYQGLEFLRNITAGSGNDNIRQATTIQENNQLNGGAGDDILGAGLGTADEVDGGIGIDTLVIDYSSVSTNVSRLGNSYITSGNRTFYSNIEQFNITTGSGNDELIGGVFNDILNGGAGNDVISGGAGNDIITQGAGADTVDGGAGVDTLVDADFSADTTGRTLIINGSTLATLVSGGDTYQGFEFFLNVTAGSGNDTIRFTSATPADNNVRGGAGNDTIEAGAGNDTLDGGTGNDVLNGGSGNDIYVVDSLGDVVIETSTLATEIDTVRSSISYTLGANLENLTLTGTSAINGTGNSLNNTIAGNSGNNILNGGAGNDSLNGGTGSDTLIGGTGNDNYVVNSAGDVVTENLNEGTDTVQSSITYTLGANLENLTLTGTSAINGTGNSLANTITGNSGSNTLNGGTGNDTLIGGGGNDIILGGDGNDTLNGVGSEFGRSTRDSLTGGNNNDLFILGNASAVFYNDGNNTNAGLNDYALITDFSIAEDRIQLRGTASSYLLGTSPIAGITGTSIYLDSNGNGTFNSTDELIAIAQGVSGLNLTASYFSYVS
ncbi:calcium-binding protein [Nostoc sp. PCC 7107]|uniref:beta strand repeat-containing protein n=1 Tax=Nostoc sp. PCC 7107 TaxID=317936 RepID=UPI00029ECA96|nr:calcium-binding protein [Nostoc sp. PCC 7107]AFY44861.1 Hemolysin-type calcium-binding region [Nostoc sp. PCC 7107]